MPVAERVAVPSGRMLPCRVIEGLWPFVRYWPTRCPSFTTASNRQVYPRAPSTLASHTSTIDHDPSKVAAVADASGIARLTAKPACRKTAPRQRKRRPTSAVPNAVRHAFLGKARLGCAAQLLLTSLNIASLLRIRLTSLHEAVQRSACELLLRSLRFAGSRRGLSWRRGLGDCAHRKQTSRQRKNDGLHFWSLGGNPNSFSRELLCRP